MLTNKERKLYKKHVIGAYKHCLSSLNRTYKVFINCSADDFAKISGDAKRATKGGSNYNDVRRNMIDKYYGTALKQYKPRYPGLREKIKNDLANAEKFLQENSK